MKRLAAFLVLLALGAGVGVFACSQTSAVPVDDEGGAEGGRSDVTEEPASCDCGGGFTCGPIACISGAQYCAIAVTCDGGAVVDAGGSTGADAGSSDGGDAGAVSPYSCPSEPASCASQADPCACLVAMLGAGCTCHDDDAGNPVVSCCPSAGASDGGDAGDGATADAGDAASVDSSDASDALTSDVVDGGATDATDGAATGDTGSLGDATGDAVPADATGG